MQGLFENSELNDICSNIATSNKDIDKIINDTDLLIDKFFIKPLETYVIFDNAKINKIFH